MHAPGFYVHVATDECFFGAGCWHPEAIALDRIRALIATKPERWLTTRDDKKFAAHWQLAGASLTRPPRGYAGNHMALEDLKRKDFIGLAPLSFAEATGPGLVKLAGTRFASAVPLMKFLCEAIKVPY